jgi:putative peptide maturation dehydrogenase
MKIRRRTSCFIQMDEALLPDFRALLSGSVTLLPSTTIELLCPYSGQNIAITPDELDTLARLPAGWSDASSLDSELFSEMRIAGFLERGLLLSDDPGDQKSVAILAAEHTSQSIGWHPLARLYQGMTSWSGVMGDEGQRPHGDADQRERLLAHASRHGPIPEHFVGHPDRRDEVALPEAVTDGTFLDLLRQRRTTRHFDTNRPLPLGPFAQVLRMTFGAFGVEELAPGMVAVKRTSPSGGALHPIEAYPLVIDVEGLTPGFHHYRGQDHALELLIPLEKDEARALANRLVIGQDYFADASALVFHVARLDRQFWKYREHPKAMRVLLLDSGHLSQTFYLAATHLGQGAFYTAAINDADIEGILCLDSSARMVIGANGIGVIDPERDELHLKPVALPQPY